MTNPVTSGIVAWLDATDASTVSGCAVTGTLSTTGTPTFANYNTKQYLAVTPSDSWSFQDLSLSQNNYTLFYVGRLSGETKKRVITAATAGANVLLGYWDGKQDACFVEGTGWVPWRDPAGFPADTPASTELKMYSLSWLNSGQPVFRGVGGEIGVGGVVSAFSSAPTQFGVNRYAGEYSDAQVGEFIVYNTRLSESQVEQVEDYLIAKWFGSGGSYPAPGYEGIPLAARLNELAGTDGLSATDAANALAGTTGESLTTALNAAAGTTGESLTTALNTLAGTTGEPAAEAARKIGGGNVNLG